MAKQERIQVSFIKMLKLLGVWCGVEQNNGCHSLFIEWLV